MVAWLVEDERIEVTGYCFIVNAVYLLILIIAVSYFVHLPGLRILKLRTALSRRGYAPRGALQRFRFVYMHCIHKTVTDVSSVLSAEKDYLYERGLIGFSPDTHTHTL